MKKILAADIGGTNSRFAFFRYDGKEGLQLAESKWLKTSESASFGELLKNLKDAGFSLRPEDADIAVFAIAGPVENGVRCSPPFIEWGIDISQAEKDFGIRHALLINDFVAQAYACRSEVGRKAEQIKKGDIVKDAAAAVIGAGTALGKALIIPDGRGGFLVNPSEGGHASFAFESGKECEFQEFLLRELGDSYITWNKVVSGMGIRLVYRFLTGESLGPEEVTDRILPSSETLEWTARFYGRACRNFALEALSTGGVYIAGGVAARTPEIVTHRTFTEEFLRSDTMADLLRNIPVFLIREQNAGLWGSAVAGMHALKKSAEDRKKERGKG